jgi:hypothetical protein
MPAAVNRRVRPPRQCGEIAFRSRIAISQHTRWPDGRWRTVDFSCPPEPEQFRKAVAHPCVDMYETVELARSGLLHAAWAADDADPSERHVAAVRLKGIAAPLASVGDTAIQLLVGIGFMWEHGAQLYFKRSVANHENARSSS